MKAKYYITEFIIIGICGTLWHFLYEWTGNSAVIGIIAPVNESTWEHLKLLFFPSLIYSAAEYFSVPEKPENYISASIAGIFAGMAAITSFFYTYTGIIGKNFIVLDIFSYFFGLFIMLYTKHKIIQHGYFLSAASKYFFIILTFFLTYCNDDFTCAFDNYITFTIYCSYFFIATCIFNS